MKSNPFTRAATAALIAGAELAGLAGTTGIASATPPPAPAIHISPTAHGMIYGDPQKAAQWSAVQSEGDRGPPLVSIVMDTKV